jgi:hypothetical protein
MAPYAHLNIPHPILLFLLAFLGIKLRKYNLYVYNAKFLVVRELAAATPRWLSA